jgi:hypothetical protein
MNFNNAFAFMLILETLAILLGIINYGWTLEALQAVTRYSGRASLAIFSVIFLFNTHPVINVRKLLSEKYFLVFAIAHGVHLFILLSYIYFSEANLVPVRLVGGFLAYALIFAMPFVQMKYDEQKISDKRFKQVTLIYLYYVWFIFFMTYLPRVRGTAVVGVGGSYKEFVILLGWISIMMGFKWSQLLAKPRR